MSAALRPLGSALVSRACLGLLVGLVIGSSYFLSSVPIILEGGGSLLDSFRSMTLRYAAGIMFVAILLTLAQRLRVRTPLRLAAVALALAVSSQPFRSLPLYYAGYFETSGFDTSRTWIYMLWMHLAVGVLLAFYFAFEESALRAQGALHEAQLAQQRAEQRVLESRLNTLRARIDPAFLFEALAATRRMYGERVHEAERLLDVLIEYLRATLPQTREQASSLAQEVRLADAYLEVAAAAFGRRLKLDAGLDAAIAAGFFPPRVLMPFVEDAVRRARGAGGRLVIRARLDGKRARVMLEDDGRPGEEMAPALHELSTTLKAFYGPEAGARLHRGLTGHALALEYPHSVAGARKEAA